MYKLPSILARGQSSEPLPDQFSDPGPDGQVEQQQRDGQQYKRHVEGNHHAEREPARRRRPARDASPCRSQSAWREPQAMWPRQRSRRPLPQAGPAHHGCPTDQPESVMPSNRASRHGASDVLRQRRSTIRTSQHGRVARKYDELRGNADRLPCQSPTLAVAGVINPMFATSTAVID
jgi:hypothetical protein